MLIGIFYGPPKKYLCYPILSQESQGPAIWRQFPSQLWSDTTWRLWTWLGIRFIGDLMSLFWNTKSSSKYLNCIWGFLLREVMFRILGVQNRMNKLGIEPATQLTQLKWRTRWPQGQGSRWTAAQKVAGRCWGWAQLVLRNPYFSIYVFWTPFFHICVFAPNASMGTTLDPQGLNTIVKAFRITCLILSPLTPENLWTCRRWFCHPYP